ncbi:YceI family protein [Bizionia sediminis]|uniref:YceI family protein n=1 Tax=Bizionia sediminis TaxID=1737064 RepID=A0ABW5KSU5_9FLAO
MTNTRAHVLRTLGIISCLLLVFNTAQAQELKLQNNQSSLTIAGTSNLHDWTIDAEKQAGFLVFNNLETGDLEKCAITIDVKGLESGKNAMNKNTYEALNYDDYKTITFNLTTVNETTSKGNNVYLVRTKGHLFIAGVKKEIDLDLTMTILGHQVTLEGEKPLKMTDYNVEPPKALFGTVKTGDEVVISFKNKFSI